MKTIIKKFKRSKTAWDNDEKKALADVMSVQNLSEKLISTEHTDDHFVFTTERDQETGFPAVTLSKKEVEDEKEAIEIAMDILDTFEGNLKPDHTETDYVFSKVRE